MNDRIFENENDILEQELNERLEQKVRRRTVVMWLTGALIALAILTGLAFLVMKIFFSVNEAAVKGSEDYTVEQLMEAAGIEKGDLLLLINGSKAGKAITEKFVMIEKADIEKVLPDKLVFTIKKETPLFWFENSAYGADGEKTSCAVVSQSQRILEVLGSREELREKYGALPEVRMPDLAYALEGKTIKFKEQGDSDYIPALLACLENSCFFDETLVLDARVRFDIAVYSGEAPDGGAKYEVRLGNKNYFEEKISMADGIAKNKLESSFYGLIDVSTSGNEELKNAYARAR